MADLCYLKPLVESVLRSKRDWSVQGFGMMRTYFGPAAEPKKFRLNIWDSRLAVPGVSTIHDHPWHFKSLIVAGAFVNVRYSISTDQGLVDEFPSHSYSIIKTGEGGGPSAALPHTCALTPHRPEIYTPGMEYEQDAQEIHETIYADGCVTLNERIPVGDGEHARVFWPYGTNWVDAMPRPATPAEVFDVVASCLQEWF